MATKITVSGGVVNCVYDDRFTPILEALGIANIHRATKVEFNNETQLWEATHLKTNQVIATGKNRNEVISAEVKWLEEKL